MLGLMWRWALLSAAVEILTLLVWSGHSCPLF
jgi:hypothetical protein